MTKTIEVITDLVRNTKHRFRQVDDRPDKPKKHRYERRKIKEYIKLGDWAGEPQPGPPPRSGLARSTFEPPLMTVHPGLSSLTTRRPYWQRGQTPKNSSLWVMDLNPFRPAISFSNSRGKQSSISTICEHRTQIR